MEHNVTIDIGEMKAVRANTDELLSENVYVGGSGCRGYEYYNLPGEYEIHYGTCNNRY